MGRLRASWDAAPCRLALGPGASYGTGMLTCESAAKYDCVPESRETKAESDSTYSTKYQGVSMPLFIKTIGHAGQPVPVNWMVDEASRCRLSSVVFPKYPRSVVRGSRLIYYAAGRQRFCAVMEVISDEPTDSKHPRWPYELALRPLLAIPADERAPNFADVGFDPVRVRRQSHIRLKPAEYTRIVDAILAAARRTTQLPYLGSEAA